MGKTLAGRMRTAARLIALTALPAAASDGIALVPAPREQAWHGGTCAVAEGDIRFSRDAALPPEGYRLDITTGGVSVASSDDAGRFYAMKTLRQLAGVGPRSQGDRPAVVPCGTVKDSPAYRWRGLLLDEGRHFFGKETVKGILDRMADYKLNVFHWHLTEDLGWRIEIPRFPELVKYGSVRPESAMHGCRGTPDDYRGNGQKYGPFFYTVEDIREILAYARERFITVVPEIELPGHVRALLAAHPEFACREGLPRVPRTMNGIEDDVLCAGNDDAIRFMEQVYDEVCDIFPGTYVHIGGDECRKGRWKECPKCQARIKALSLKDEDGLQAWVTRHFTDHLAKKGRRAIGWDEVFAGNPGKETIIQGWHIQHGNKFGLLAAEAGYPTIVSDKHSTYLDYPQGVADDPYTYLDPNMRLSLEKAYSFDPLAGMTDAAKRNVMGAECCMWSECVWNEYDLAFKLWPRACAFAEAVWTAPAEPRDFADFRRRVAVHRKRLVAAGVNCAPVEGKGLGPCASGAPAAVPSPSACVRACPDGPASANRLWNGIAPKVKEWELGRRAEALKWFEENQFGKTPCGRLPDEVIGETSVSFTNAGIRIDICCRLPADADAAHPVPVFLFGDHRGGKMPPDYPQETYEGIPTNSITARGYAYVRWNFNDVCPNVDARNSFFRWPLGIVAYVANGDRTATNVVRAANGWGTIGAWAWGNSRVMDWIETRPELDASRVAVLGHSRGGKTALWTAAQDERFAMAISNGSGCGGARLGRAGDPKAETIRQIVERFPNWFCPAFSAWIDRDVELPHDADDLIRLIAPRLVYVASGSEDAWAGPAAEKAAWDSAHDLYEAYGLGERMGYHCHDGAHRLRADDWERFMDFADSRLKAPSTADSDAIARRIAAACADGSRAVALARNAASPDGVWRLTRAIVLPDDFTLVFDGCRVELADGVQDNLVRNAGAREGRCEPNRGIRILGRNGAVLSGGRRNHYLPRRSGDPNGWRSVGILLCDVSDYEVGGFAMEETQCWAISQERCCRGRVHDISFGSSDVMFNQDGVDVRKGCHDLVIENLSGSTGDDVVALTAYRDPQGSPARYGMQIGGNADLGERDDVYNVAIRNVKARSAGGHGVIRLLTCDGIKMHHITVEDVVDTASGDQKRSQAAIRIGDSHYHKTRRCEMGEMHHVSVRGVTASGRVAVWVRGPLRDSDIVSVAEAPGGVKCKVDAPTENVAFDR